MTKTLDYSNLDLAERRSIEHVVDRYRISRISRATLVHDLVMLGYGKEGVIRYVDLVESTLERGAFQIRAGRNSSCWYSPWGRGSSSGAGSLGGER